MKIVHYDGISNTPALLLAVKGWLENVEAKRSELVLNIGYDHQAIVFFMDDEELVPVGVITWEYLAHAKQVWVQQSYVLPAWRLRGIYSAMWDELIKKAKEKQAVKISSATGTSNIVMRKIAALQGRFEEAVTLSLIL